jgi:hypothetical protein
VKGKAGSFYNVILISALSLILSVISFGQNNVGSIWQDVDEASITDNQNREIIPQNYRTLALNIAELQTILSQAPLEFSEEAKTSNVILELPLPEGGYGLFNILESPVMEQALALKYPEIKTYIGKGITEGIFNVRFDFTSTGFHASIRTINGTIYIDPFSRGNVTNYISYYKKDFVSSQPFICIVLNDADDEEAQLIKNLIISGINYSVGEELRIYRLALAATGEYTIFHGGTVEAGMNAVVTAVNRINQVYENEAAIRLVLIANNDILIYTDPATDPYTNSSGNSMLEQNQSNLDAVIGNSNYDIGHVFATDGGSVAQPYVVCRTGLKAKGVSGFGEPVGDPFYIDKVAHEIGHQFGGAHTFNGNGDGCYDGQNGETAYEPGSGSTIMAYAGLCGSQNLQMNSDDYFHGTSLDGIIAYSTTGSGSNCPTVVSTGNNAPVVTVPAGGFTIPINTPFSLTGSATDPNGDDLTYCWEEFDLGPFGHPNFPSGNAPIFRSFKPVDTSARVFPQISDIVNNTQTIGEILPSYSRNLTFRLTARDNRAGGGGVGKSSNIAFTVTNSAGPFIVTYPNTVINIPALSEVTVTWNVANTNSSPVNCANVNILLSIDGGQTFPLTLAEDVPNDGSHQVLIPDVRTSTARIKVNAADNIFFDISNENFIIEDPLPVELVSFTGSFLKDKIKLEWRTVTEINNYGFDIERASLSASPLQGWEKIAFIKGYGFSYSPKFYSFTDDKISRLTKISYRLKQIDFDGSFTYSDELDFNILPERFALEQNYPNPFNPETVIKFQLPSKEFVSLKIYNVLGIEVAVIINEEREAGVHEITFNADGLTSGVYYYTLLAGDFVKTNKMILLK